MAFTRFLFIDAITVFVFASRYGNSYEALLNNAVYDYESSVFVTHIFVYVSPTHDTTSVRYAFGVETTAIQFFVTSTRTIRSIVAEYTAFTASV